VSGYNAAFLDVSELHRLGFRALGDNPQIHRTVVFVDCSLVSLGDHVRIDPYCVISAKEGVEIGKYVHVSSHCALLGQSRIVLEDYSGVSAGSRLLSSTDDFSGAHLAGPGIPAEFRQVRSAEIRLGRFGVIGAGSVVMPGVSIGEGTAVGAMSFVNRSLEPWGMYAGIPARRIGDRKKGLLALEEKLRNSQP
jgi:galactoside O-acetyltransferase